MKAIGEKCGWVIPRKERRVLKLLRTRTRVRDHEFVTNCPVIARRKPFLRIRVEFGQEELSAFEPPVVIRSKPGV